MSLKLRHNKYVTEQRERLRQYGFKKLEYIQGLTIKVEI